MRLMWCRIKQAFIHTFTNKELIVKTLLAILSLLLVASCSSTQKGETSSASSNPAQSTSISTAKPVAASVSADQASANVLTTELQALQKDNVFFDFDKFAVKSEYQAVMEKQATFIKGHKNDIVTLEGNCDERGSKAYNLALGGKRANAVLEGLKKLGVSSSQLKAVSNGKEKPKVLCHEEKCWKENRRVDFVHSIN